MGVEINRFSRNPSFTFYNFLCFYLGNFQSAFQKSQFVIYAQFHPCFHDEIFLYILMTGFWLFMTNFVHQHYLENFPLFRLSSFESTTDINVKQYMAIDIYVKLTNLILLLSSSKLFPLNAQVEDWRGALQKRLKALKLIRSCAYLILFNRQIGGPD